MLFKGVIQVEMVGYDGLASLGLFIIFSLELQGATPWHSLSDITLKTQKSKSYNFQFDMCPNDCHHSWWWKSGSGGEHRILPYFNRKL